MTTSHKASAPATASDAESDSNAPIVVDMGKKSRKDVRKLRKGQSGRLMDRVEETLDHLKENGALTEGAQVVVFVVKEKSKRKGRKMGKIWGLG